MANDNDVPASAPRGDRPLILVAPRVEECQPCLKMPEKLAAEETCATVFFDAILAAGGLPLMMPLTEDEGTLEQLVDMADGVALPGGHDVDPALWGDTEPYDPKLLCPERDSFEARLVRAAVAADKPLFATCRGAQILNVALGGSLNMDVPSVKLREGMVPWRHTAILNDPAHPVEVKQGSLLHRVVGGALLLQTNSSHHCCVDRLGKGVELVARATDGIPEAIEVPNRTFCLGVQWHPEYTWRRIQTDFNLWKAFADAARAYRAG